MTRSSIYTTTNRSGCALNLGGEVAVEWLQVNRTIPFEGDPDASVSNRIIDSEWAYFGANDSI